MASIQAAQDFLTFVDASPTPFHAVHSAKEKLEKAGFKHIKVGLLSSQSMTILTSLRNAIHGHQLSNRAASTTSHEMDLPSSPLQSEISGSLGTLLP